MGRAALALADARRHELRPARGARRHPVAVPGRGPSRLAVPARAAVGATRSRARRRRSRSSSTSRPYEALDAEYPLRLTTGRRLESYNTGVQTNRYRSPLHRGESLDLSPEDAERLLRRGGRDRARRPRAAASVERRCTSTRRCGPGSAFMTFHFPDQVDTNLLTIDATDPKSGTAEFKACRDPGRQAHAAAARPTAPRSREPADGPGRLMDIHLLDAAPTSAERAAVDARARRRRRAAGTGGVARLRSTAALRAAAGTRRAARGTCCCRRCSRCRSTSAGSARARSTTSCERLTVPPADAYGVATFYALLSVEPRPPRVVHVCEDLACRCDGSRRADRAARGAASAPRATCNDDGSATWLRSPCLGQCDRAPAAMLTVAGEHPEEHVLAPVDARDVLAALDGREVAQRRSRRRPLPQSGDGLAAAARARRAGRPDEPRRLPRARRLRGAARRSSSAPRGRHPRGQGLEADGPRRRRVPDRRQVGGRRAPAGPARTT